MMETFILPGFSLKNKAWAEEMQTALDLSFPTTVINWSHWQTGQTEPNWIEMETKKIIDLIGDKKINILAKSIGTAVAMEVIKIKSAFINKIILCGIPTYDLNPGDEAYYEPLKTFLEDRVLCIQNEDDNHGSFTEVEKFLHAINPNLRIVSKLRSDHEYPYNQDFMNFFKAAEDNF